MERCQHHDDFRDDMKATHQEIRDSIAQLTDSVTNLYELKAGQDYIDKLEISMKTIEQEIHKLRVHIDEQDTVSETESRDYSDTVLQTAYEYTDKLNKNTKSLMLKLFVGFPIILMVVRLIVDYLTNR